MNALGERLRAARQAKGLSLRDLGKQIDRAFETIGSVERGERTPSKELLRRLCAALDLDLAELMPLSGRLPPEMVAYLCAAPAAREVVWQMMAAGFRPEPILVGPTPPEVLSRQQELLTELAASPPPRFCAGYTGRPMDQAEVAATLAGSSPSVGLRAPVGEDGVLRMSSVGFLPGTDGSAPSKQAQFMAEGENSPPAQLLGGMYWQKPEPEEDEGAPPPSPEHEAAGAVLALTVNPGHEGRLLFHAADGELLEAAADGVQHTVPVGTDHVKMMIRRKA